MKPTTHTIPETAFREDRQPSGAMYIETRETFTRPAPVTDHETIERRLARIEADVREIKRFLTEDRP